VLARGGTVSCEGVKHTDEGCDFPRTQITGSEVLMAGRLRANLTVRWIASHQPKGQNLRRSSAASTATPRPARSHMLACLAASAFVPQPRCQWAGAASHRAAWLMAASPDEEKQSKVDPKVERDAATISDGIINAVDTVAAIGSLLNPRGVVKPTRSAVQAATAASQNTSAANPNLTLLAA